MPKGATFHSLRKKFTTRMENFGVPENHINRLLGHDDGSIALDVYSGGLAIEPLRKSMKKLSYGEEVDNCINSLLPKKP